MSDNHGKLTTDGSGRCCDKHGVHGFLYCCSDYPDELQKKIKSDGLEFSRICTNGEIIVDKNGIRKTWNEWQIIGGLDE